MDIKRDFLRIVRESGTGGDVVGNTTVALSVLTDQDLIWKRSTSDKRGREDRDGDLLLVVSDAHLYDGPGELDDDKASLTATPQASLPHCALFASVWMLYEWRDVVGGRENYEESCQSVILHREADVHPRVEIVPADDVSPAVWSIQIVPAVRSISDPPQFLMANVVGSESGRELVFTDHDIASKVAHWARTHVGKDIGNLRFNNRPDDRLQPVKTVHDECDEALSRTNPK